jgi:hypothetical protein
VVHVAAVEHLHPELVVHEHLRRRRGSVKSRLSLCLSEVKMNKPH